MGRDPRKRAVFPLGMQHTMMQLGPIRESGARARGSEKETGRTPIHPSHPGNKDARTHARTMYHGGAGRNRDPWLRARPHDPLEDAGYAYPPGIMGESPGTLCPDGTSTEVAPPPDCRRR